MKAKHGLVQSAVKCERDYQDSKWGTIDEHPHEIGGWITIIRNELREAEDAWCKKCDDRETLQEILQIASVCFACMEQHGVVPREKAVPVRE